MRPYQNCEDGEIVLSSLHISLPFLVPSQKH